MTMDAPCRRVSDKEMEAVIGKALMHLMAKHAITPEQLKRKLMESTILLKPMRPFGLFVQAQRRAQNMTRRQMARRAGLNLHVVTALERGLLPLSLTVLMNIAFALQLSPEYILQKSGWPFFGKDGDPA
jgi:DNA-binding XRE family transcriptional regulator